MVGAPDEGLANFEGMEANLTLALTPKVTEVNAVDSYGWTALHAAATHDRDVTLPTLQP